MNFSRRYDARRTVAKKHGLFWISRGVGEGWIYLPDLWDGWTSCSSFLPPNYLVKGEAQSLGHDLPYPDDPVGSNPGAGFAFGGGARVRGTLCQGRRCPCSRQMKHLLRPTKLAHEQATRRTASDPGMDLSK